MRAEIQCGVGPGIWQMVDPIRFLREYSARIYHGHVRDVAVRPDGVSGILGSHLKFGDPRAAESGGVLILTSPYNFSERWRK